MPAKRAPSQDPEGMPQRKMRCAMGDHAYRSPKPVAYIIEPFDMLNIEGFWLRASVY